MNKRRLPDDIFRGIHHGPNVKTYRLFLGVFPPESYINTFRKVIREFDREKRNLKLIPMDQIHVTLKFIGAAVTENSKNMIAEALNKQQGKYPKPTIKMERVQFGFTYQNDPRVLMIKVEDGKELLDLGNMAHGVIRDLRLMDTIRWKEKNSGDFHLSLARLKDAATRSTGKEVAKITRSIEFTPPEPFTADTMELVESQLTKQGIVYKRLAKIKL